MKRFFSAVFVTVIASGLSTGTARADDKDVKATLDKAMKALGGEEKLDKVKAVTWKSKGTITFNGNENEITVQATAQGLDHYRSEFEGDFNGNKFKGITVLNGDKGWRKFGEMSMEMDKDAVANEKRTVYLALVSTMIVPLKDKKFKVESAPDEKVGDKPAAVLKVTGPDGKESTIYFDKESGLPLKQKARVAGFNGEEFEQENTYADYKEFDGIKKATKVTSKRDGEPFITQEITEFKVLDKVDSDTFTEPK